MLKWMERLVEHTYLGSPILTYVGTVRLHGLACIQHGLGDGWRFPQSKGHLRSFPAI